MTTTTPIFLAQTPVVDELSRFLNVSECVLLFALSTRFAEHLKENEFVARSLQYDRGFAAIVGHLRAIVWMHANKIAYCTTDYTLHYAAKNGYLCFHTLYRTGRDITGRDARTDTMDFAAAGGRLEIIQWLHENTADGCTRFAMGLAALNGHLEVLKWLHENRSEGCTWLAMNWAVRRGHLQVVKWLHANRSEGCSRLAIADAACGGHLETVQFLHENRIGGCLKKAMQLPICNRHEHVVQWWASHPDNTDDNKK